MSAAWLRHSNTPTQCTFITWNDGSSLSGFAGRGSLRQLPRGMHGVWGQSAAGRPPDEAALAALPPVPRAAAQPAPCAGAAAGPPPACAWLVTAEVGCDSGMLAPLQEASIPAAPAQLVPPPCAGACTCSRCCSDYLHGRAFASEVDRLASRRLSDLACAVILPY